MLDSIKAILPGSAAIAFAETTGWRGSLYPEEAAYIRNSIPERQVEFAAGRTCARRLLSQFGITPRAIPTGRWREPIWPALMSASLTHQDNHCIAVGGWQKDLSLIGIDLATVQPLDAASAELVCTSKEMAAMKCQKVRRSPIDRSKLIFSIKEAVYKCLFPLTKKVFDFVDVAVHFDPVSDTTSIELLNQELFGHIKKKLEVRYCHTDAYVFSVVWAE
jgi:4'-phosphopantetheinyl transferase EntD